MRVAPSRPARTSYGPFSREAEDRGRDCPAPARRRAAAGARQPGHPQHRDVVARVERDRGRVEPRPGAAQQHLGVVLARHHVRVGDDDAVARHPARALDAEPARRPEDLHHAGRGRPHLRVAADALRGRRHVRLRPVDLRERVEARQRVEQRPRRRQRLVEPRRGSPSAGPRSGRRRWSGPRPRRGSTPRRARRRRSAARRGRRRRSRSRAASASSAGARRAPRSRPRSRRRRISAPTSPIAGAYGLREPSGSTTPASRVPEPRAEREADRARALP